MEYTAQIDPLNDRDEKEKQLRSIESGMNRLNAWGARLTGNSAHIECVDWIAAEFEKLGLTVHRDRHWFTSWNVQDEKILVDLNGTAISATSAYPFSGTTGPEGILAPLIRVRGKDYSKVHGKIAVVEVPHKAIPVRALVDLRETLPIGEWSLTESMYNPVLSATVFGPNLRKLREAGAVGVLAIWRDMDVGMASGQFLPFTFPYRDIPAAWVAGDDGKKIIEAAKSGRSARFTLPGNAGNKVPADSLWTVIEGKKTNESILIVTHTDGTNPVEENGFLVQLDLARRLVEAGLKPERTIIFLAVAGHLRLPDIARGKHEQATTIWLREHPDLWDGKRGHRKAVAGMALEHIGSMEWATENEIFSPTGIPDIELTYATTEPLRAIVREAWTSRRIPYRAAVVTPRSIVHLGEGEPLYESGIPEISVLGIPSLLLAVPQSQGMGLTQNRVESLFDVRLAADQCDAVYGALRRLLALPTGKFGRVRHARLPGRIRDILAMLPVLTR